MLKSTDYDNPWKEALARYFPSFLDFCFPEAYADIDWARGYQLLDQELRQVTRRASTGFRRIDLLVQVWRRDGTEAWVLVYVEVQTQPRPGFARRLRRCHHRLEDRYDRPVVSLAVLADEDPSWRPERDGYALWGCAVSLEFPTVKLLDLDEAALAASPNPIAAVIRAHRRAQETRRSPVRRLRGKIELVQELYRSGLGRDEVLELLRLVDWFLNLPEPQEEQFWQTLAKWEKEQQMPYVTSWERRGLKRGEQIGRVLGAQEEVLENLTLAYGGVPAEVDAAVRAVTDLARLRALNRAAITASSLDEFRQQLGA